MRMMEMLSPARRIAILRALLAIGLGVGPASALRAAEPEPPPRNPYLADSSYPLGHGTASMQGATPVAGPRGTTRKLEPDEIDYVHLGPAHFGAYTSSPYPDGRRVVWSNGVDRIVKQDHEGFEILATHRLGTREYDEAEAERAIGSLGSTGTFRAFLYALRLTRMLLDLSGVYTLLDRDGDYYIGGHDGITAWGDAVRGDPGSPIVARRSFTLPAEVTGKMMGMNLTHDGWLIVATEHGFVVAVSRDFTTHHVARLRHAEGAEDKATRPVGGGWVRNGFAIDPEGGIYVASQEHMHKVVWTGSRLSVDEADGAWSAAYRNGGGEGTGATPSLMGFGDEDRLVVITDGDARMNLVAFWRDAVPEGWAPPEGAPSRRIAGQLAVDMGDPELEAIQSEQSVVVAGYGALVVNNEPRNVPWWMPRRLRPILISFLGSRPEHQPYGVQKLEWDPAARRLRPAWVNLEVSSPNCVPIVSLGSGRVYHVGARDRRWTLEALDWETGESDFHWEVGGERYNSLFAGTLIDEAGRMAWGTTWGRVRLSPRPAVP